MVEFQSPTGGDDGEPAASPLRITLRASPMLVALIVGLHLAAVAALVAGGAAGWMKLCGAFVLLATACRALRAHGLRASAGAVVSVVLHAPDRWRLTRADGSAVDARLSNIDYLHPQLVCLRFDDTRSAASAHGSVGRGRLACAVPWRRIGVVIPADATTPAAHRRLRVVLRSPPLR
ncbi:MAG: protein YgfX [Gammaproteobacteria bacterium]